jgi:hypothetical protein
VVRELLVLPLQQLGSDLQVEGELREPGELESFLVQAVPAEEQLVGEVLVDEVPLVRVVRVRVADPAQELPPLELQAEGEAAGLEEDLLRFDPLLAQGEEGLDVE